MSRSSRKLKKESNQLKILWVKSNLFFALGFTIVQNNFPLPPPKFCPPRRTCSILERKSHVLFWYVFHIMKQAIWILGQEPQTANKMEWGYESRGVMSQQQKGCPHPELSPPVGVTLAINPGHSMDGGWSLPAKKHTTKLQTKLKSASSASLWTQSWAAKTGCRACLRGLTADLPGWNSNGEPPGHHCRPLHFIIQSGFWHWD